MRLLYVVTEDWYFLSHRLPMARAARDAGFEVHVATRVVDGAAAIIDRSGGTLDFGVPYQTVIQLALPTYDADVCPLCKQGVPVTKPGSRPE